MPSRSVESSRRHGVTEHFATIAGAVHADDPARSARSASSAFSRAGPRRSCSPSTLHPRHTFRTTVGEGVVGQARNDGLSEFLEGHLVRAMSTPSPEARRPGGRSRGRGSRSRAASASANIRRCRGTVDEMVGHLAPGVVNGQSVESTDSAAHLRQNDEIAKSALRSTIRPLCRS